MDKSYGKEKKMAENASNYIDTTYGEKLDRNGYAPSLLNNEDETCYFRERGLLWRCRGYCTETARHEVFFGPNRTNSKRTGMWCNVCPNCHREIHQTDGEKDRLLKKEAQEAFEKVRSHEDFIAIFGKNYL